MRSRLFQYQQIDLPELHRRAGRWYEQHGFIDEAIRHALEAKDLNRTADPQRRADIYDASAPLFPGAAAIITDVGAHLSHAAIVARELIAPSVVGCINATTRLRNGDRVLVDGGRGVVEIIAPA